MSTVVGPTCEKLTNIKHIEVQFAKMTCRIKRALVNNKVDVVALIEQLCAISAVKNKKVPLFDEDVFENIKSIDDFWRKLKPFWNIFDIELLRCVVEISGCWEAQEILEDFLLRIDPSAIGEEDLVLHCSEEHYEGSLRPVLKIKVRTAKCTLYIKEMVEEVVIKTYNLDRYGLCFHGIKEDIYVELLYYISQPLKSHMLKFEISAAMVAVFLAHKIVSLHIDEFDLKIPSKIADITVSPEPIGMLYELRKECKSVYHYFSGNKITDLSSYIICDRACKINFVSINFTELYFH